MQVKSLQEIEAWALAAVKRLEGGQPVEDARVELKAEWPKPEKAARRIAGHANAATPEDILWIVGVDEGKRLVRGVQPTELSTWWDGVATNFEGLAPSYREVVVPLEGRSIVAILLETDRAPYVVRNPVFGDARGGPVQFEVPWRSGTSIRSAKRRELLSILAPQARFPEVEIVEASFTAAMANNRVGADFYSHLYFVPPPKEICVFPRHRSFVRVDIDGLHPFERLDISFAEPADRHGMRPGTATEITGTSTELIGADPA